MKTIVILTNSLLRWLTLTVFLFGSLFYTAQTAQAAGPCTPNLLHQGIISADETWCTGGDNIHYLNGDVTVQAGVTLTIAAGVTVDSTADAWSKYLVVQGHLDIAGTPAQPVYLTRSYNYPNQNWAGLFFDGSQGDGSGSINYAIIDHAGSNFLPPGCVGLCGNAQTAVFVKDLAVGKQVTISNSTIHDNTSKGLFVVDSTVNVTNTTFSQNKYPIWIEGAKSVVTYSGNTFTNNAYPNYDIINYTVQEDSIFLGPDALTGQDFSLPAQNGLDAYVYHSGASIPSGMTMTIEPGVTLRMTGDRYLTVQGNLNAVGTPALPIRFSSIPSSGPSVTLYWGGLYFDGTAGDGSGSINYATIDHAGANFLPPGCVGLCGNAQTAVFVKDLAVGKQVTISHSTIHNNISKGLFVVDSAVNVANTTFSQNKYPIWIEGAKSVVAYSGNTFTNNTYPNNDNINYTVQEDSIFLGPDALTGQNFSLPAQNGLDAYVYHSGASIPLGITMTIEPGVTLRMTGDRYLSVHGYLNAVGTPELPIRFSSIPSSGPSVTLYWGGLYFDGTAGGGGGAISHAIIENGGSYSLPPGCTGTCGTAQTAVFVKDLPANKQLNISNSIIQDSLSKGMYVVNSHTAHLDNNVIKGGQIGVDFASNMIVSNLAVIDQTLDGVIVETGFTVDARHLTIARAGRSGFHVYTGGTGLLKNSILSHNTLGVWPEGSASTSLDTNLADANTVFHTGTVTIINLIDGSASFEADGYHIQTNSPAVGVGLDGLCTVDIDGDARPWPAGTRPDLGADEVSAGKFHIFLPLLKR